MEDDGPKPGHSPELGLSPELNVSPPLPAADPKRRLSSATVAYQLSQLPSPPLSPEQRNRDLEAFPFPPPAQVADSEKDPLLLRSKHTATAGPHDEGLRHRRSLKDKRQLSKLDRFYTLQDEHIDNLLKPIERHESEARKEEDNFRAKVKIAIYASIIANFVLAGLQLYAAASSLSLSFFATAIDSVFDPFANLLLNYLHRKAPKVDPKHFPAGGNRLEVIGNICYAFLMGSVSAILIAFSIQDIIQNAATGKTNDFHVPAVIAVAIAFITKLSLFLYCFSIRSQSSQVEVLWEDHRNDLFINGFGIVTSSLGAKAAWWIDPMGAIILSIVIITVWGRTAYQQFRMLAGVAAPADFMQLVIYKAMTFADEIEKIDSCKAYHSGADYIVCVLSPLPSSRTQRNRHRHAGLDTALESSRHFAATSWKHCRESNAHSFTVCCFHSMPLTYIQVDHEVEHQPEHRKRI